MARPKDEKPKIAPGSQEEFVLRQVFHERGEAYGRSVRDAYAEFSGKELALTTIYTILDRLEKKGFVTHEWTEPTNERGGRRKQKFSITGSGIKALEDLEAMQDRLRNNFPVPQPSGRLIPGGGGA